MHDTSSVVYPQRMDPQMPFFLCFSSLECRTNWNAFPVCLKPYICTFVEPLQKNWVLAGDFCLIIGWVLLHLWNFFLACTIPVWQVERNWLTDALLIPNTVLSPSLSPDTSWHTVFIFTTTGPDYAIYPAFRFSPIFLLPKTIRKTTPSFPFPTSSKLGNILPAFNRFDIFPPNFKEEIKEDQWLGVTVRSGGKGRKVMVNIQKMRKREENLRLLTLRSKLSNFDSFFFFLQVCAHRYVRKQGENRWGQGLCYTLSQLLDWDQDWQPCAGEPVRQ